MRIDSRHFNKFMAVVAAVAAVLIAIATLNYTSGRESAFHRQMIEADSLDTISFPYATRNDSLRIQDFRGRYVLLDFWAPWSEPSLDAQKRLVSQNHSLLDSMTVIAASVRADSREVREYQEAHTYPFEFVDGTAFYQRMNLPGVPSQVLFDRNGNVIATFVGYSGPAHFDSLRTHFHNE